MGVNEVFEREAREMLESNCAVCMNLFGCVFAPEKDCEHYRKFHFYEDYSLERWFSEYEERGL